jgi:hypothetical protein
MGVKINVKEEDVKKLDEGSNRTENIRDTVTPIAEHQ